MIPAALKKKRLMYTINQKRVCFQLGKVEIPFH